MVLHDLEVVCAVVQIEELPPYWAVLQSLDLYWTWVRNDMITSFYKLLTPPPQVLLHLPQEPHDAQDA